MCAYIYIYLVTLANNLFPLFDFYTGRRRQQNDSRAAAAVAAFTFAKVYPTLVWVFALILALALAWLEPWALDTH